MKTTNNPKVTVVTVTYNAEKYLERTIKSVIEQDYRNIEYIIIDGASTDGTIEIIKKYEKHIDYWISEPDKGIYDAMNKGSSISSGEWINFMNAGDSFCAKNVLTKLVYELENDTEIIYGSTRQINESNELIYLQKPENINHIMFKMPFGHQSLLLRNSLMKRYKYDITYKLGSDRDLITKLYLNNHKYKIVNFEIANYLQNLDGASRKNFIRGHLEVLTIVASHSNNPNDIYLNLSYKRLKENEPKKDDLSKIISKLYLDAEALSSRFDKIVIYGYSNFAKMISHIFSNNQLIYVDKKADKINLSNVYNVTYLSSYSYDKIIIAVLGREEEIKKYLSDRYFIPESKFFTFNLQ